MSKRRAIVAFDASKRSTGVVVIDPDHLHKLPGSEDYWTSVLLTRVWKNPDGQSEENMFRVTISRWRALRYELKFRGIDISYAAFEDFAYGGRQMNNKSSHVIMQAGILRAMCVDEDIPYLLVSTFTVKAFACGGLPERSKLRDKTIVVDAMARTFGFPYDEDCHDLADAYSLAVLAVFVVERLQGKAYSGPETLHTKSIKVVADRTIDARFRDVCAKKHRPRIALFRTEPEAVFGVQCERCGEWMAPVVSLVGRESKMRAAVDMQNGKILKLGGDWSDYEYCK